MAKAKSNKSQAIRDLLAANPKFSTREIVETLASKGMKVSGNLVYALKSKGKAKKRKQKREAAVSVSKESGILDAAQAIVKVRALAAELGGGIRGLKRLVDLLAE